MFVYKVMKKFIIILGIFCSLPSFAQKTWSFYINGGVGTSSAVTLEGLSMESADAEYFTQRGITPEFLSEGKPQNAPIFNMGISRYFGECRVSAQVGSNYINQSNYHAYNTTGDILFGYNFLRGNHELITEVGVGVYYVTNHFVYDWKGIDSATGDVLERRTVDLGEHNVLSPTIPVKVSYAYNFAGNSWLGIFAQARYNFADDAYCPTYTIGAGLEYRLTLGQKKVKSVKSCPCRPTVNYIFNTYNTYNITVSSPRAIEPEVIETVVYKEFPQTVSVFFDFNSSILTAGEVARLTEFASQCDKPVLVVGYTDSVGGNGEYNDRLSISRANVVSKFLKDHGVDVILTDGFGVRSMDDVSPDARQLNRRVDIIEN